MELTEKFREYLENTGIEFAHRNRASISLSDLFVFPDLKSIKGILEGVEPNISAENLWNHGNQILILGDEQSGKTSLAKRLFADALSSGYSPMLIDGDAISFVKIEEQIPKLLSQIYSNISADDFLRQPNLVCIVDNLSAGKQSKRVKKIFLQSLNAIFTHTILFAEESFKFITPDFPELDEYNKFEILPFGSVRRNELIEKWINLGITEETDDREVFKEIDELTTLVDSLVRKDLVPAKPIYILMFLQSLETITPQRLELTSFGHCYQYLIYQALERVKVKQTDVDTYLNVLTELGGEILESGAESLNSYDLDVFKTKYSSNFLAIEDKIIDNLVKSGILKFTEMGSIKFRYPYLFYFFAAKKLSDLLSKGEVAKKRIQDLVKMIHLEKESNIILFLTHHSKDNWIIDEILISVMDVFSKEKEVTLEVDSLSFLQEFVKEIPELVIEQREARQIRLEENKRKDFANENENDIDSDENLPEFVVEMNKAFRAIEVCGQILRNRLGSLERNQMEMIFEETLSVSLRFLGLFLKISEFVKEDAIREIQKMLDKSPNLSNLRITREAESFYMAINYTFIYAMLQKVSLSLGSPKGREVCIKVAEKKGTPASYLIQKIIKLQFENNIDHANIDRLLDKFSRNPICSRLLKQIILRHCYRNDFGHSERQRLSAKLNIQIHPPTKNGLKKIN